MAGSELVLAVLCKALVLPCPYNRTVIVDSFLTGSESPAVHTAANTERSPLDNDLSTVRKITVGIVVEHDVIETGLGNSHLWSVLTYHEKSLLDLHVRVIRIVLAIRIILVITVVHLCKIGSVELFVSSGILNESELLATLKIDILLVHSGTG